MFSSPFVALREDDCSPGTTFYSCGANKFRGCCSTDPCALHSCPDYFGSLKDPKDGDKEDGSSTTSEPKSDEATPTSTEDDQSQQATETASSQSTTTTKKSSVIMTDSGITHTIPNNSIVTITRHTTITTGRPSSSTSDLTDTASTRTGTPITASITATFTELPSSPPANDSSTASSSEAPGTTPLSTGTIVGITVGGAVLIAIAVVLMLALVRRKKRRGSETDSVLRQDNGRDDVVDEKHFPNNGPTDASGTQGNSDPFAPFGGRADQPEDPYRPASGAFEMDGSSAAPIELPAVSTSSPGKANRKASRLEPVQEAASTDPRANLTSVPTDDGQPLYVNHWNQYKSLG
ncbi:hypothetical protein T069G_06838 [Trichoderma breve]|uniref:Uncharacterized protein n=1 Tax=Trichoderma breve TaxID=2034170 RepID=A0A9W9BEW8_9HYPO|nr:hypothetical protein T069G_06838 [Trichoderma breve]KAJ4858571.1 hypothetical protein T069G_06838 [Trichoderma breve]